MNICLQTISIHCWRRPAPKSANYPGLGQAASICFQKFSSVYRVAGHPTLWIPNRGLHSTTCRLSGYYPTWRQYYTQLNNFPWYSKLYTYNWVNTILIYILYWSPKAVKTPVSIDKRAASSIAIFKSNILLCRAQYVMA